jgi:hypothetical protein
MCVVAYDKSFDDLGKQRKTIMKSSRFVKNGIFFYRCVKNTKWCLGSMAASRTFDIQLAGGPTYN